MEIAYPINTVQVFYSYTHEDGQLRKKLETHLSTLRRQGVIAGWYDRNIGAGAEWRYETDKHLNTAQIILLLISPSFIDSDYCYETEMKRAMERHERGEALVIPIILRPTDLMNTSFKDLHSLPSDGKPVTKWKNRDEAFLDIAQGIRKAVEKLTIFSSHDEENADKVIGTSPKVDWGEAPRPSQFYGRKKELVQLKQWIMNARCHMVAVLGIGGIGKTSLAATLVEQIQNEFDYVYWRSLQNAPLLKDILQDCVKFISDQQQIDLPTDEDRQISILMEYLRNCRTLLILDNGESILEAGTQAGQYREGYEGYGRLLQRAGETRHQSCLILTSREKPKEIAYLEGKISPVHSLRVSGLEQAAGRKILKDKGLIESRTVCNALIYAYSGNPLALNLVSATIRDLFEGSITEFLKESELSTGVQDLLDQQFQRLSLLERSLMYWLAIEREEVSLEDLRENIITPVAMRDILNALRSLRQRSMIERNGARYFSLQPVIIEYITFAIIEQMYKEIKSEVLEIFVSHALTKAQSKEHVRDAQTCLIVTPVAERLLETTERVEIETKLKRILSALRKKQPQHSGYAVANIIHLLLQLQCNLFGYDFSYLVVRQAYLRGVSLSDVNFAHSSIIGSVFTETFGRVLSIAFSPIDNILAAGTANSDVKLRRTPNGMLLHTLEGHTDWVRSVAFSPDGNILATGSADKTVHLWDVKTGQCLKTLQGHTNQIWTVTFSPDGRLIATGSYDKTIRLWDVKTGQCLKTLQGHTNQIWTVTFSPDSKLIASCSYDQAVHLWDTATGQCLKTLQGHIDWIRSVAFSPNGEILASGSEDRTVRLWDVRTSQCLKTLQGHDEGLWSVAFSPNGKLIATGSSDKTVRLWDVRTGQCLKTLQGHIDWVRSVAFSPNGEILASGSGDRTLRFWDTSTGQCFNILQGHGESLWSVAFSPNGSILAGGGDDQIIRLWDTSTNQLLRTLQGHAHWVLSVAFNPNGNILASGSQDQTVRLWDTSTGQCRKILRGHTNWVLSVAFNPNGDILASGSQDQTVRLWDTSTGQCLKTLQGHTNWVRSIAFSPDGSVLASGSGDRTVRLWDASTGQCFNVLQGHDETLWSIAFSPDSRQIATGSSDKTVRFWHTSTGQCLKTLQGHTDWVRSVAFSPNGEILASGGGDRTVRIWNINSGQCLKTLQGHHHWVRSVTFSPDGSILASGSEDGTIKFWDVKTAECLQTLRIVRPYERMNITNVNGLTIAQKAMLRMLGSIEDNKIN